jgi:hypothetical protein
VTITDRASAPTTLPDLPPWCKSAPAGTAANDGPPLADQLFERLVTDMLLRSLPARPDLADDLPTLGRLSIWSFVSRQLEEVMHGRARGEISEDMAWWIESQVAKAKAATDTVARLDALAARIATAAAARRQREAEMETARDMVQASMQLSDEMRKSRALGAGAVPAMPIG